MASYDNIPLTWNDPLLSGATTSGAVTLQDGGTLSYRSITADGSSASVYGNGSFTLDHVRVNSSEAVRIAGSGNITISNSYLEATGSGADHADVIQAYDPGGTGNVTITNTTIVAHNTAATAGMFIADDYAGTFTFNNVVFEGGPFGLRMHGGGSDMSISLTDVYFVGPFEYDPIYLTGLNITHWENVRYATIVDGKLVPGDLIPAPFPVQDGSGGGSSVVTPTIDHFTTDSGVAGDHITNDNALTLTGTAAANSTVKVLDGSTQVGAATANSSGVWTLTTSALADGSHSLTATATSGGSSSTSAALSVKVDTAAPSAPTIAASTSAATLASTHVEVLTGTAEANSTVKVFDGTTQIGTATATASGAWSYTTGALATGNHSLTAKATDAAGNTGAASTALAVNIPSTTPTPPTTPTAPGAPKIASFSNDSGVAGDGITNDNTLTLTGSAAANSTVKVFDGTNQIGTATANSSGAWSYTTAALADGAHNLTAKATDSSGQTSAASPALAVKIDTSAPTAPTIAESSSASTSLAGKAAAGAASDAVALTGTAEANSTVKVFDGTTQIGTATANSSGAWSLTTGELAAGNHSLTAKATDAAGNTGAASTALAVDVPSTTPTGPTTPTAPGTPKIASFSNDTGVKGDGITSDNTLTLTGTAAADSTVKVFDGAKQVGTATANSSGAWNYTTAALADGSHSLTATATDAAGHTSAASSALAVKIDTSAPTAPTIAESSSSSASLAGKAAAGAASDVVSLTGTAEANSTVKVFDGTTQIGTATTDNSGAWNFKTGTLSAGDHSFTSKAMDAAGNTSGASAALAIKVDAPDAHGSQSDITNVFQHWWNDTVTFKGTADPYSQITIYDNGKAGIGTVKAGSDGTWSLTSKSAVSDTVHNFTTKATDSAGNVSSGTGSAVLGTHSADTLKSTSGDDLLKGNGGHDTFVFAPNFGNDVIKDFHASGWGHDVVQVSKSVFDNFADVLAHATQSGHDVVINAGGGNALTLKDTKLAALDKTDFHFS